MVDGMQLASAPHADAPSAADQKELTSQCSICLTDFSDLKRHERVGIMPNCEHIFCLTCITQWRSSAKDDDDDDDDDPFAILAQRRQVETTRKCPNCRSLSYFVVPSQRAPKTQAERVRIIDEYKDRCSRTPCKHFKESQGRRCPFGNECLYAHNNAQGERVVLPERQLGRRRRQSEAMFDMAAMEHIMWHFYGGFASDEDETEDESDDDDDGSVYYCCSTCGGHRNEPESDEEESDEDYETTDDESDHWFESEDDDSDFSGVYCEGCGSYH
jgi:E3 ubiquitin-protein ligase makorin